MVLLKKLIVKLSQARGLINKGSFQCKVKLLDQDFKTKSVKNSLTPSWNQNFLNSFYLE